MKGELSSSRRQAHEHVLRIVRASTLQDAWMSTRLAPQQLVGARTPSSGTAEVRSGRMTVDATGYAATDGPSRRQETQHDD